MFVCVCKSRTTDAQCVDQIRRQPEGYLDVSVRRRRNMCVYACPCYPCVRGIGVGVHVGVRCVPVSAHLCRRRSGFVVRSERIIICAGVRARDRVFAYVFV